MNSLRWILLAAGVVLIAGIVIWDRMRRPATRADERPTFDRIDKADKIDKPDRFDKTDKADDRLRTAPQLTAPQLKAPRGTVPQLDEAVAVRPRAREPLAPPIVAAAHTPYDADALPPMSALGDPASHSPRHAELRVQPVEPSDAMVATRREPTLDSHPNDRVSPDRLSTGAFIAAQALSTQSMRAAMHEAQGEPEQELAQPTPLPNSPPNAEAVATPRMETAARIPKRPPASRKIVALRLSAGAQHVEGSRLKSLLEQADLKHGKYSIYHRMNGDGATLFSVASMVEPGTFDPFVMSGVQFPGVTLFMQLPGPLPGDEMFTQMLTCARLLEQGIGGELHDERGQPVNTVREQRIRDDIADFEHLLGRANA